jgi:hypothetical protein
MFDVVDRYTIDHNMQAFLQACLSMPSRVYQCNNASLLPVKPSGTLLVFFYIHLLNVQLRKTQRDQENRNTDPIQKI